MLMKSLWNDEEAARRTGAHGHLLYLAQLIGREPELLLAGSGNCSVKLTRPDVFGEPAELLCINGRQKDLATLAEQDLAVLHLPYLQRLAQLETLSDHELARQLRLASADPQSPPVDSDALLHAILPQRFVLQTQADALMTLCNTPAALEHVQAVCSETILTIPAARPGMELLQTCRALLRDHDPARLEGILVLRHGVLTLGESAQEAYQHLLKLVSQAEEYLVRRNAWQLPEHHLPQATNLARRDLAALRREISAAAQAPLIMMTHSDASCLAFVRRPDLTTCAGQGPALAAQVFSTGRVPLIGRNLSAYVANYNRYYDEYSSRDSSRLHRRDPAPRIILDPEIGMLSAGHSAAEALQAATLYRRTMQMIQRAGMLDRWQAPPPAEVFAIEYSALAQAVSAAERPVFAGEIALVSGAASGIGRACVEALTRRGAAVVGLDINPRITELYDRPDVLGLHCDVTDEAALDAAIDATVRRFGGLDMLILNAGQFPATRMIAGLDSAEWRRIHAINLDANLFLMRECHALLRLAPRGGRVVVIGTKNVPAPGPGLAAFSSSKAALTQLARVAALEWGAQGIRVNVLHPNQVFDTGMWNEDVIRSRASTYGVSVEQYKTNNVLRVDVHSSNVAELAAELCGPLFAKTTGAQIPIDGGNDRVI